MILIVTRLSISYRYSESTNAPTTGSLDFDDTNATNQARFYRAVENP
jgi:hypothetical protein